MPIFANGGIRRFQEVIINQTSLSILRSELPHIELQKCRYISSYREILFRKNIFYTYAPLFIIIVTQTMTHFINLFLHQLTSLMNYQSIISVQNISDGMRHEKSTTISSGCTVANVVIILFRQPIRPTTGSRLF